MSIETKAEIKSLVGKIIKIIIRSFCKSFITVLSVAALLEHKCSNIWIKSEYLLEHLDHSDAVDAVQQIITILASVEGDQWPECLANEKKQWLSVRSDSFRTDGRTQFWQSAISGNQKHQIFTNKLIHY